MIVVPATDVTKDMITSSNIPENDYPVWNSSTAYVVGDKVTIGEFNYEALVENTNASPLTDKSSPPKWLNLGYINRLRMFSKRIGNVWKVGTFTEFEGGIDTTISLPKRINSIGFVDVEAVAIEISLIVDEEVVYEFTQPIRQRGGGSWWRYFFAPFSFRQSFVKLDLPPIIGAQLRIRAISPASKARIGMVVFGMSRKIGNASWGSSFGFDNYSLTQEDDFGNVSITQRGKRDWLELDVVVRTTEVPAVERVLSSLKDTAALYIGSQRVEPTIIVGKFDRFSLLLANPTLSEYVLEIRSLV